MPATLNPQSSSSPLDPEILQGDYSYDYPEGLDLKPDTETHRRLLSKILERARVAKNAISSNYDGWRQIDDSLRLYARPDYRNGFGISNISKSSKGYDEDAKDDSPTFVMPVSQANLETLMTYMTSAFLADPMFKYDGQGPEDVVGAMLMQQVIQQMVERNTVALNVHTMIRDSFAYGFGASHPNWSASFGSVVRERPKSNALSRISQLLGYPTEMERVVEPGIIYEGVALTNIDPYRYFPDPSVSIYETQKAEYISWLDDSTFGNLLSRDKDENDFIFNAKYLRKADGLSSLGSDSADDRKNKPVTSLSSQVDILWMYIDLIPAEWKLGTSDYPEPWLFGVAGDKVIVAAQPLDFVHGNKPAVVAAPDFDGHNAIPTSRMGSISSLQSFIDFLYTSRITNMRKSLNDMFVVDPSLVNIHDLKNPAPGKLIRIRKAQWGRASIDNAIKQLNVLDVTSGNVNEMQLLEQFANNYTGVPDSMAGNIVNRGPRISATATGGARSSSFSKLERIATIIDLQAMKPMGRMFASYVQQYLEEDVYVQMTGENAERLNNLYNPGDKVRVTPMDLLVNYDLKTSTSTVPGSQDPNVWISLLQIAAQMPDPSVINSLDMPKIFLHIARQLGTNNPETFIRQATPTVLPDEEVAQEVAAGNLIPAEA